MILFYAFRLAKYRRLVIDYHRALKIIEGIAYSEVTESGRVRAGEQTIGKQM
jgi:hypothetical protein